MRKHKRKHRVMNTFLIILCSMVFLVSAGMLIKYFYETYHASGQLSDLKKLQTEREDMWTEKGTIIGKYVDLYEKNADIIGWIRVPDTNIDYPVMYTPEEPEFYLRRDFDKNYSIPGTPFMDSLSSVYTPTCNLLIYGHHIKSGIMFQNLLKFDNEEFYKEHKTFYFDTIYKGGQGTYEILAAGYTKIYPDTSTAFKYYQYAGITEKEEFDEYVKGVKSLSCYETGVTAEYGDQLVTLSTCAYHTEDGRFFVVGKRTDRKMTPPLF